MINAVTIQLTLSFLQVPPPPKQPKAGLRAGEIAGLSWDMVLGPSGEVGTTIELHDKAAKKAAAGWFRFTLICALR